MATKRTLPSNNNNKRQTAKAAPVAYPNRRNQQAPKVSTLSNGGIRVRHSEFIDDVAGSVAFASTKFEVNPGLSRTFTWLSKLARNYESYKFHFLDFVFRTSTSTATAGRVMLIPDYDAADAAPTSKSQALSYRSAVGSETWAQELRLRATLQDLQKLKTHYVRSLINLPANLDIKTYDVMNLFLCTQGMSGTTDVGELYVEYDVELMTPQTSPDELFGFKGTGAATFTAAKPLGSAVTGNANNTISISYDGGTGTFTFNEPFTGLAVITCTGSSVDDPLPGGGTATKAIFGDLASAGGVTIGTAVWSIDADVGETWIPAFTTFATPSASKIAFAHFPLSLF